VSHPATCRVISIEKEQQQLPSTCDATTLPQCGAVCVGRPNRLAPSVTHVHLPGHSGLLSHMPRILPADMLGTSRYCRLDLTQPRMLFCKLQDLSQ
jgi:hypothetical protein